MTIHGNMPTPAEARERDKLDEGCQCHRNIDPATLSDLEPLKATCGTCKGSWCERCDPGPSALCPTCHGRGYSLAPLEPDEVSAETIEPDGRSELIEKARAGYQTEDVQIYDDAEFLVTDDGTWVGAFVWVSNES